MIKEQSTQEKPVFGKDFETKKKRVQKDEKPVAHPTPKKLCQFQVLKDVNKIGPITLMGSSQCEEEALPNGWCEKHQHAQIGMDLGERLGFQSVEIPMGVMVGDEEFKIIIGQGRDNWMGYFEHARKPGLDTVLRFLEKKVANAQR